MMLQTYLLSPVSHRILHLKAEEKMREFSRSVVEHEDTVNTSEPHAKNGQDGPVRMTKIQNTTSPNTGESVRQRVRDSHSSPVGVQNGPATLEDSFGDFLQN